MSSYDLQRLGSVGFQDVVSALAIAVFGPQVRPMGRGKDGGRDLLVCDGVITWSATEHKEGAEVWKGTTVFQVKHKQTLEGTKKDAAWFWSHIKEELDTWADPDAGRGRVPDYVVFATNVPLTPVGGSGGFDTINANIRRYFDALKDEHAEDELEKSRQPGARKRRQARRDRMANLRKWRLWDGNQLTGLLNQREGVRRAFEGFLTPGDVLYDISKLSTNLTQEQLGTALKDHARSALLSERRVYFDEAGGESGGVPVEDVAIDLPVLVGARRTRDRVVSYVLERGERVLQPDVTTFDKPRHLVLTGAPGNGKSTVAKFLTHAYRTVFMGENVDLGDEHRKTVARTRDALTAMKVRVPANRRWPVNIDLAKFASEQSTDDRYSLLNWIAARLTKQTASKDIPRWELRTWLRRWPSFIVLDGLDEVSEPSVRKTLIANIEAFAGVAESENWDVLIVVTTRPTGYQDELPSAMFERIDLTDLTISDALRYGQLVTKVRIPDDEARQERIVSQLRQAAEDDGTKHLLRTPLQTLIMSIIAESSKHFAPSRYALFWGYYTTIARREQNKESSLARLLREHPQEVLELHLRVGLLLQIQAETATGADAVLSSQDLHDEAWKVLIEAEYEPATHDRDLLDNIVQASTHRLVLLTPRPGGGYGFDVRSLQELMAAYALTTGTLEETMPRLRRIAASPHWRNTFLFAAGRLFTEPQPHQQRAITEFILTLDHDAPQRLGSAFPVGPNLAAEIIDDGTVTIPKYLHPLVNHALTALDQPAGYETHGYARMLMAAATASDAVRGLIADGLRTALGGTRASRVNAEEVQRAIRDIGQAIGARPIVLGLAGVRRDHTKTLPAEPVPDWEAFRTTLREYAEPSNEESLRVVAGLLEGLEAVRGLKDSQLDDLVAFLEDRDNAFVVQEALHHVAAGSPHLMAILRHDLLPRMWRRPVDLTDNPQCP